MGPTSASIQAQSLLSNGERLRAGEPNSSLDAPVQRGVTGGRQRSWLQVCCPLLLLLRGCSSLDEVV